MAFLKWGQTEIQLETIKLARYYLFSSNEEPIPFYRMYLQFANPWGHSKNFTGEDANSLCTHFRTKLNNFTVNVSEVYDQGTILVLYLNYSGGTFYKFSMATYRDVLKALNLLDFAYTQPKIGDREIIKKDGIWQTSGAVWLKEFEEWLAANPG